MLLQVPEINFDTVSAVPVLNQTTPTAFLSTETRFNSELDFLLADIKNTIDFDLGDVDMSTPIVSLQTTNTTPFTNQDDITFYDDSIPAIKSEKADSGYDKYYTNPSQTKSQEGSNLVLTPQSSTATDPDMDEAKKEVDDVCLLLNIPAGEFSLTY